MAIDYIADLMQKDNNLSADNVRYQGDIIISYDNQIVLAQNFYADFSDQYRQFDIMLGLPYGQGYEINESVPYKGNNYEPGIIRQTFANISISPITIRPNEDLITFSTYDRNTNQIVVPDIIYNILQNSSFEETSLPFAADTLLQDGGSSSDELDSKEWLHFT
jgi:hypothetical protein